MRSGGPRKKLSIIKKLEGNPGQRPIEDYGIEISGVPLVPEHLAKDVQRCMEVIIRSMPPKVYGTVDTFVLAAFAQAWALHKHAAQKIAAPGFHHVLQNQRINPWIKVLNEQTMIMATLGDRLGLNPKARDQIKLPKGAQQASKFDGLIGLEGSSISLSA
jgi:phage terminase small subunit